MRTQPPAMRVAAGARSIRSAAVLAIAAVLLTTAACATPSPPSSPSPSATTAATGAYPEETAAKIAAAVESGMAAQSIPGALVLVQTPAGRFEQAFGVADTADGTPLGLDDHLRVGSITKTMTTTVLLQLVERGEVQLDEPARTYLPALPDTWARVTLRQLAEMRSGIPPYSGTQPFVDRYEADEQAVFSSDDLVAFVADAPLLFAPGEGFDYSNTNTVILGMVIEAVTGASLADNLAELYAQAGLSQTAYALSGADVPEPRAQGYTDLTPDGSTVASTDWSASWAQAAGAAASTLGDLEIWLDALVTGSLLSDDVQSERMQLVPIPGNPDSTGYGIGIVRTNGWLGHNGDIAGFSVTMYAREDGSKVIVMTTSSIVPDVPVDPRPPSASLAEAVSAVVVPDAPYVFPAVEG